MLTSVIEGKDCFSVVSALLYQLLHKLPGKNVIFFTPHRIEKSDNDFGQSSGDKKFEIIMSTKVILILQHVSTCLNINQLYLSFILDVEFKDNKNQTDQIC